MDVDFNFPHRKENMNTNVMATGVKLKQTGNGKVDHVDFSHDIEPGETVSISTTPRTEDKGLMVRLNTKAGEAITLNRGTLWLLGAGVVILNLAFSYGGSVMGWARSDQSQKEQLINVQTDMKRISESQERLEKKFNDVDDRLRVQEINSAKTDGFKTGLAAGDKK